MSTAAARNLPAAEKAFVFPRDVIEVCSAGRRQLLPFVSTAVRLASQAFAPVRDVSTEIDVDPDTDERRVVVNVTADLPPQEMLQRYRDYIRQWVDAAPADVREQIRLSYHAPQEA